jgi:o-succinylbenzoate---CoA ligase
MEGQKLPNWLKQRAYLTPQRTAIIYQDKSYSFKDTYEASYNLAGKLASLSIEKNQFVGVLLKNHIDTLFILYALQMLGVKAVILNNRLTEEEIAWQIKDSACSSLITEDILSEGISKLRKNLPDCPIYLKTELENGEAIVPKLLEEFDLDDVCTIMYTSGTTGFPKGVMQTYGNHWWSAMGSALNLGLMEQDRWLCTMPLFHISGYSILVRSVVYGMTVVLHDNFDEQMVIQDINKHNVTIMSVVSTMLARIINKLGEQKLPSTFRCMLLGGGPAPLSLLVKCQSNSIPVFQTYGMTETASQIVTLSPEYSLKKLGSAGKPLFPAQLKIVDVDGTQLSNKEEGEIVVKGPNVTKGYLYREDITREKIKDGWLATGDIGYLDDEGFLYVLDRRSDLIISGGENIYPAEIEGVLLANENIEDAGIIGIDDETWGQVPIAVVVSKVDSRGTEMEIISYCQQKLARYKVPKRIIFCDQLPRNAAKKLLRRVLRDQFERGEIR